jgi:hypothetical protein
MIRWVVRMLKKIISFILFHIFRRRCFYAIKKFVPVITKFEEDGKITPLKILWEDGRAFDVDFIFDIRPSSSLTVGGQGIRYLCRIKNKDVYVYYEKSK